MHVTVFHQKYLPASEAARGAEPKFDQVFDFTLPNGSLPHGTLLRLLFIEANADDHSQPSLMAAAYKHPGRRSLSQGDQVLIDDGSQNVDLYRCEAVGWRRIGGSMQEVTESPQAPQVPAPR